GRPRDGRQLGGRAALRDGGGAASDGDEGDAGARQHSGERVEGQPAPHQAPKSDGQARRRTRAAATRRSNTPAPSSTGLRTPGPLPPPVWGAPRGVGAAAPAPADSPGVGVPEPAAEPPGPDVAGLPGRLVLGPPVGPVVGPAAPAPRDGEGACPGPAVVRVGVGAAVVRPGPAGPVVPAP